MSTPLIQTLDPPACGPPHRAYGHMTLVPLGPLKLLTIAGQVGRDAVSGAVPPYLAAQLDICFGKIKACLAAAGGSVQDITRIVYYVVDYEQETMLQMCTDKIVGFLEGHRPASCFLGVKALSDRRFRVEVEAQAVVRGESGGEMDTST